MIKYLPDFVTLIDSSGRTQGPRDSGYFDMLQTMAAQDAASTTNQTAANTYHDALAAYQVSVDAGRGSTVTAPTKPQMIVVDDKGNASKVDFVPPLPDPKPASVPTPGGLPGVQAPILSTDDLGKKLDIIVSLLLQILKKG